MNRPFALFSGTASRGLAEAIAGHLGIPLGRSEAMRFPDGESFVQILEPVRGKDAYIVQSTSPPVNDHLMELLAFADACRRAGAHHVTAVVPYFGYSRSDKRHGRQEPIMASMVAALLQSVGVDRLMMVDPHAAQIEGFFHIAVDSLTAVPALYEAVKQHLPVDAVVVSPDAGRVGMATAYAQLLGTTLVVLHKERQTGTETTVTRVVGDVGGRACLVVDDIISTGGTIAHAVAALLQAGARPQITVAATHAVLSENAPANLSHPAIRGLFVTDSIAVDETTWPSLTTVSIAPLLAAAIRDSLIGNTAAACS
ncbi:MAG: ribose-phosphate diphosphokinase [Anaerolineae bacterium]